MNKLCFVLTVIVLTATACKPIQVIRQDKVLPLPGSVVGDSLSQTDSLGFGGRSWRLFFTDPNLQQLIDTALYGSYDLQIASRQIQQNEAYVLAARAPFLPEADLVASSSLRRFGLYTMDGAGNATTDIISGKLVPINLPDYFGGIQASWEIDLWGKLRSQKKAAVARFLASVEGKNLVQTRLVALVAEVYFKLQALDAQTQILDEYITLQQNALTLVQVQKQAGMADELAVKQFENQLMDLQGTRIDLDQQIREHENLINVLLGRFPQPVSRSPLFLQQTLPEVDISSVPPQILENRPDIRAASLELSASKADLDAARAMFYPSLNLGAALGTQAFRPDLLLTQPQSLAYTLAGGLAAPIVNRRALKANFMQADAYQYEALASYHQAIVGAYTEVYNYLFFMNNLRRQYELKTKQTTAINLAVDISGDLFRSGRANYLDVLTAQQNALETRLELVDLRLRQWANAVGLYRSLGGGWQ
ncbi:MAG: efflux transporter outer membrane subunit [Bacteroidia bacterium]|nr:efflux transporter outer membrane subunit [Bacteroidia bacterium]